MIRRRVQGGTLDDGGRGLREHTARREKHSPRRYGPNSRTSSRQESGPAAAPAPASVPR